jgi:hypothetical protein
VLVQFCWEDLSERSHLEDLDIEMDLYEDDCVILS